jgi:hypothetical protein
VGTVAIGEVAEGAEGAEGSAVENVVEILLSLPLVVKEAIASVVKLEFSDAFPAISLPLCGTIGAKERANAVAAVLCLTVSFETGLVGRIVLHWFGGASLPELREQYSRKALFPGPVTKLYETWRLSMRKGPRRPILNAFSLTNC